jgi:N-acetylglutamate synthase-like GNAT family acetyltransferase
MEPADSAVVREFLLREAPNAGQPDTALLGKLVGELVAVLAMEFTADSVTIRDLVVAHDLRRKRIGRFMIEELQALAAKMDRVSLVVGCEAPAGFLRRTGFGEDGVRRV